MTKTSIPKIIHYCWLSGDKIPDNAVKCIDSWKKHMPEYELVLWDSNKFDINSHMFVKEACLAKKWAFASDYVRLYALYTEGGIYLDIDVYIKKSLNCFLNNGFFTGVEYHEGQAKQVLHLLNEDGTLKEKTNMEMLTNGIQIQAAIMGSVKGHPFLKSCMNWYNSKRFILEDGSYFDKIISPDIYAHVALEYGFRYKNELQKIKNNMTVYPNAVFAGSLAQETDESYAVHRCEASWRSKRYMIVWKLKKNNFLRAIFGKKKLEKI
ncbi:MAG: hypothetical protein LBI42_01580 [Chitinispirillales bacterium]|jgi:mannosyltransferase OCH1-like enzyme|nr:hypothetical protein [Chitinispirillales bacterium]